MYLASTHIQYNTTHWSEQAYPHLVSTNGISRYSSINALLKAVKLREQVRFIAHENGMGAHVGST